MSATACKHFSSYKAIYPPKCTCSFCWDKYFTVNHGIWLGTKMAMREAGRDKVVGKFGDRYVKQYERYTRDVLKQGVSQ
jgi:hypothetical protein